MWRQPFNVSREDAKVVNFLRLQGYIFVPFPELRDSRIHWLRCAAANQRKLQRIVGLMQMRSRKILLETLPEPSRRKRLSKVTELGQT